MRDLGRFAVDPDVRSIADFGTMVADAVDKRIRHDGYILVATDPVDHGFSLYAARDGYRPDTYQQWLPEEMDGDDTHSFVNLFEDSAIVSALGGPADSARHERRLRALGQDGLGAEMRIALKQGRHTRGFLILVRDAGRKPFSADEISTAESMTGDLGGAVQRFVMGNPIGPLRTHLSPGVVVVNARNEVTTVTPSAYKWIELLFPEVATDPDVRFGWVWSMVVIAQLQGGTASNRHPTSNGWATCHAELLPDGGAVLTLQSASTDDRLPVVSRWFDVTPREETVIGHALAGLPMKQIARALDLSPYTVNDHFKSIYRKLGISGRDELAALLG